LTIQGARGGLRSIVVFKALGQRELAQIAHPSRQTGRSPRNIEAYGIQAMEGGITLSNMRIASSAWSALPIPRNPNAAPTQRSKIAEVCFHGQKFVRRKTNPDCNSRFSVLAYGREAGAQSILHRPRIGERSTEVAEVGYVRNRECCRSSSSFRVERLCVGDVNTCVVSFETLAFGNREQLHQDGHRY